jgi:hypothetical protein
MGKFRVRGILFNSNSFMALVVEYMIMSSAIFSHILSSPTCYERDVEVDGRAIAKAVSRRLPTAAARVRARVRSCGICGGQSGTVAGFLRVFRFPLPIFIPPITPQSPSSIIWAWYKRANSGRSTKWTQSHPMRKIKIKTRVRLLTPSPMNNVHKETVVPHFTYPYQNIFNSHRIDTIHLNEKLFGLRDHTT